jgi:hypothetical protein
MKENSGSGVDTVYLVHHSHMDIGFTDLAEVVREQQLRNLDLALELCERPRICPDEPDFCWTIESAWVVQDYLRLRSAREVERLFAALRRGQLELEAFYTQPLTESAMAEESIESVRFAAELGRRHGFPVQCAMLNDIGGYMGRLPSILNGWGVRYFVAGVGSYQVHLPWSHLPHLFYLQDKAGGRILIWNLGIDRTQKPQAMDCFDAVYYMGGTCLITPFAEANEHRLQERKEAAVGTFSKFAGRLQAENYAYAEVMLQYATDNGGPDPELPSLLKQLREYKELPRIELITPLRFFQLVERKYQSQIPILSGVITDPWVLRVNPQPASLAKHRAAQLQLLAAEARGVEAWRHSGRTPDGVAEAYEALHLYTDHTFGLDEFGWPNTWANASGTRDALFDHFRHSWFDKGRYADRALQLANALDRDARERTLAGIVGGDSAIVVWNDNPLAATGLAELTIPQTQRAGLLRSVHDATTGESVPIQRIAACRYVIKASNVPPLSYRVLQAKWERDPQPWPATNSQSLPSCPSVLESNRLLLTLDPETGAVRQVKDKQTGKTWLSTSAVYGLGEFCYARVRNVAPMRKESGMGSGIRHEWIRGKPGRVWRTMEGPLLMGLARERLFTTSKEFVRVIEEIRLPVDEPRVDFYYRLDKPETAEKESCYIWFGCDLPQAVFRCDQAVGWIEPRNDLIPGAMQDAFYASRWADLSDASRGITLVCHDAPLVQVGRIRTYEWRDQLPFSEDNSALIAWPYHNLPQTDNPIWQDLLLKVRYSLFLHGEHGFDPVQSDHDATSALFPLRAQPFTADPRAVAGTSWMVMESNTVRINGCHLSPDGRTVRLRLEERGGSAAQVALHIALPVAKAWKAQTFFGDEGKSLKMDGDNVSLTLEPYELATILFELRPN